MILFTIRFYMNSISPAIIVLGQASVTTARGIAIALPNATLYGLANRTSDVDVSFENFGETLRELFVSGTPIIGICAAGILIRTLAPMLSNKYAEPPVLAVAEDGSAVVPLLGGINGANELARQIAAVFNATPAITTTGDIRFRTALLSPPAGYYLANRDDAKKFISDLLAGATLKLEGEAPWLRESKLPIASDGQLTIQITESAVIPTKDCLVYHPKTLAIGFASDDSVTSLNRDRPNPPLPLPCEGRGECLLPSPGRGGVGGEVKLSPEEAVSQVQEILDKANLSAKSLAGVFALNTDANHPAIGAIASAFNIPVRFFTLDEIANQYTDSVAGAIAITAGGDNAAFPGSCLGTSQNSIAVSPFPIDADKIGRSRGHLAIVGTGPGAEYWMSPEVKDILKNATDWIGYKTYLDLAEPLRKGQQRHEFDNREELDRARIALDMAAEGRSVALVSSGDPGIYAMAAAVFEVLEQENKPSWATIEIQVCPGISAMQAAAATVGAPLGHDFCAISLSDILKPWDIIEQRIAAAAKADFVIAFYNPISKQRTWQLAAAKEILLKMREPSTPVVLARNLGRSGQSVKVCTLSEFIPEDADMRTIILIGSSKTRTITHMHKKWVYTPRRY